MSGTLAHRTSSKGASNRRLPPGLPLIKTVARFLWSQYFFHIFFHWQDISCIIGLLTIFKRPGNAEIANGSGMMLTGDGRRDLRNHRRRNFTRHTHSCGNFNSLLCQSAFLPGQGSPIVFRSKVMTSFTSGSCATMPRIVVFRVLEVRANRRNINAFMPAGRRRVNCSVIHLQTRIYTIGKLRTGSGRSSGSFSHHKGACIKDFKHSLGQKKQTHVEPPWSKYGDLNASFLYGKECVWMWHDMKRRTNKQTQLTCPEANECTHGQTGILLDIALHIHEL